MFSNIPAVSVGPLAKLMMGDNSRLTKTRWIGTDFNNENWLCSIPIVTKIRMDFMCYYTKPAVCDTYPYTIGSCAFLFRQYSPKTVEGNRIEKPSGWVVKSCCVLCGTCESVRLCSAEKLGTRGTITLPRPTAGRATDGRQRPPYLYQRGFSSLARLPLLLRHWWHTQF